MCVLVRIKVRGHLATSIIQFMNLTSVHFWTYLNFPAIANSGKFPSQMERLFPSRSKLAISLVDQNKQIQQNGNENFCRKWSGNFVGTEKAEYLRRSPVYSEKLGTFRFDYEYEIEYEYDFSNLAAFAWSGCPLVAQVLFQGSPYLLVNKHGKRESCGDATDLKFESRTRTLI